MASAPRCGLRPGKVWRFDAAPGSARQKVYGGFEVAEHSEFSLAYFPDLGHDSTRNDSPGPNWGACQLRLEFILDDGEWTLPDQHGHRVDGERRCLVGENWNLLRLNLRELAGRRVEQVDLVSVAHPGGGWFQFFGPQVMPGEPTDVVQRVRTTRGSHSGYLYSRGNTLPLTCVPHGFNFLVPLTNARDGHWLYGYHRDGGPTPGLQALAISHQPSPWIGERASLQLMPWQATKPPNSVAGRTRAFTHEVESDRPHHYSVELQGGITAEMTPTSHAGLFRFHWNDTDERHGVIIDQGFHARTQAWQLEDGRAAFSVVITPLLPPSGDYEHKDPTAFIYGETTLPARVSRIREWRSPLEGMQWRGKRLHRSWLGRVLTLPLVRPQAVVVETRDEVLEVRAATSFISVDQARRALHLEVGERSFAEVCRETHGQWKRLLERLDIEGGTLDDRTNAWSNLARLYCWPNAHHEFTGSEESPSWAYASPFWPVGSQTPSRGTHEPTVAPIVSGQLQVNNGFWDTARTCWPLYSLLTPSHARTLVDGILQQYRDGGWMARWSAPGYVDIMPGTTSDAIFADAAVQGTLDDELTAYDSALRNANVVSERAACGRKGIGRGRYVGYIDTDTPDGLAWTMENATCDAAIALWSRRLAQRAQAGEAVVAERAEEFEANARWFTNRSLSHELVFDQRIGFYQGRDAQGRWRHDPDDFDPRVWGPDYVETNAWGQRFHAQHDGAGLARLLGGERRLGHVLDEMLTTPAITRPWMWGRHDYNTQEMNEAQNTGIGQLAISNQPAHHIPFMYLFAGQPWRTQWLTRELLDTQFIGSEIGQGYPGDEDNGEMSGWWLCVAMGLYPLFVGSGEWVVTAPLFPRWSFRRDDGTMLEVRAENSQHRYIQSLEINGRSWDRVTIPMEVLRGDCLLQFVLGPEPSRWGSDTRPRSLSVGANGVVSRRSDLSSQSLRQGPAELVDDTGLRPCLLGEGEVVLFEFDTALVLDVLTLTGPDREAPAVRVDIRDGDGVWGDSGITPRRSKWAGQTQAYCLPRVPITALRLVLVAPTTLTQVELY